MDSLAEAGLVARGEVGEDRRTYRVQLTPEGNAFLASMLPDHMQRMQRLMQALTPDERQVVRRAGGEAPGAGGGVPPRPGRSGLSPHLPSSSRSCALQESFDVPPSHRRS